MFPCKIQEAIGSTSLVAHSRAVKTAFKIIKDELDLTRAQLAGVKGRVLNKIEKAIKDLWDDALGVLSTLESVVDGCDIVLRRDYSQMENDPLNFQGNVCGMLVALPGAMELWRGSSGVQFTYNTSSFELIHIEVSKDMLTRKLGVPGDPFSLGILTPFHEENQRFEQWIEEQQSAPKFLGLTILNEAAMQVSRSGYAQVVTLTPTLFMLFQKMFNSGPEGLPRLRALELSGSDSALRQTISRIRDALLPLDLTVKKYTIVEA